MGPMGSCSYGVESKVNSQSAGAGVLHFYVAVVFQGVLGDSALEAQLEEDWVVATDFIPFPQVLKQPRHISYTFVDLQ